MRLPTTLSLLAKHQMAQLWLTSYGSPEYNTTLELLRMSAYMHGEVDHVVLWTEEAGDVECSLGFFEFKQANPDIFNNRVKGGGYYSLKPYVIAQTLAQMSPGDVLIYCDATCLIRSTLKPLVTTSAVSLFQLVGGTYLNRDWTKPQLFDMMHATTASRDTQQLNAAVQTYSNTPAAREFAGTYLRWCCKPEAMSEEGWQRHRHDQSVLTILSQDNHSLVRPAWRF